MLCKCSFYAITYRNERGNCQMSWCNTLSCVLFTPSTEFVVYRKKYANKAIVLQIIRPRTKLFLNSSHSVIRPLQWKADWRLWSLFCADGWGDGTDVTEGHRLLCPLFFIFPAPVPPEWKLPERKAKYKHTRTKQAHRHDSPIKCFDKAKRSTCIQTFPSFMRTINLKKKSGECSAYLIFY